MGKQTKKSELAIFYSNSSRNGQESKGEVITFEKLVQLAKSKDFLNYINKYCSVTFYCPSFTAFARPFLTAVICRLMTLGKCKWVDVDGRTMNVGVCNLVKLFCAFLYENCTYKSMLKSTAKEVEKLLKTQTEKKECDFAGRPLYLRCDLSYGYIAGGSIGHIAGVLNNLEECTGGKPIFVSTDDIPTVSEDIEKYLLKDKVRYSNVRDVAGIAYNEVVFKNLDEIVSREKISFIYQRSALNAYAGIKCAIKHNLPFILEYNGSEVWISNKWGGRKLKGGDISQRIEELTFRKADLIVCVSTPLKDQLIEMGIEADKIIVNPNGVNADVYNPEVDGTYVRERLGIKEDRTVVGFIGTFGAWHGAEVLAQAYARVVNKDEYKDKVHLLLVGDGLKMPEVKSIIRENGIDNLCSLTGVVPQKDGPVHLAACDILVSPQVRNADGTPFFGSPTKLFEYMAMGKAIITSDMDQMAEIFENEVTALLCEPGNVDEVASAIERLVNEKEFRTELGKNAREEVCRKYTWRLHTEKIIDALKTRV